MQPLGLTIKDNEAYLNGHKITDLAKEYKTPLYVMDETTIKNAITTCKMKYAAHRYENMKSDKYRFDLVYASKAFLTLEFVKYIDALQLHIDAVSLGDLYVIQKSGMSLNKVVFHGNNKSNEEIEFAIKNNIGYLVIDNMNELEKVITISNKLQKAVYYLKNYGMSYTTKKALRKIGIPVSEESEYMTWCRRNTASKEELEKQNKSLDIYMCNNLEESVNLAKKLAKPKQIVLFSPASASFDMFKNFADRGIKFKNIVNKLVMHISIEISILYTK